MPKTTYVERPRQIDAEQFQDKNNPSWPQYVDDCGAIPGPHVHLILGDPTTPVLLPVHDTDWIIYEGADGTSVSVLTDAQFEATYVKKTGP